MSVFRQFHFADGDLSRSCKLLFYFLSYRPAWLGLRQGVFTCVG